GDDFGLFRLMGLPPFAWLGPEDDIKLPPIELAFQASGEFVFRFEKSLRCMYVNLAIAVVDRTNLHDILERPFSNDSPAEACHRERHVSSLLRFPRNDNKRQGVVIGVAEGEKNVMEVEKANEGASLQTGPEARRARPAVNHLGIGHAQRDRA